MVFVLQEPGMPTWSLLKRFEPFNLHNWHNLNFAVQQTCAEISYYPQFCGWIQLPCMQFRHNCGRAMCSGGHWCSIWLKNSIWHSNTVVTMSPDDVAWEPNQKATCAHQVLVHCNTSAAVSLWCILCIILGGSWTWSWVSGWWWICWTNKTYPILTSSHWREGKKTYLHLNGPWSLTEPDSQLKVA